MCLCVRTLPLAYGSLTLSAVLFQACFTIFKLPQGNYKCLLRTPQLITLHLCAAFPQTQILGLGFSVFPFHSPLLRKSWLFSFPPLIKMLQFSGLILFKLRFISNCLVLVIIKLFLIYYFLTFLFLNSQTQQCVVMNQKL